MRFLTAMFGIVNAGETGAEPGRFWERKGSQPKGTKTGSFLSRTDALYHTEEKGARLLQLSCSNSAVAHLC